jgi:hypothetical protein
VQPTTATAAEATSTKPVPIAASNTPANTPAPTPQATASGTATTGEAATPTLAGTVKADFSTATANSTLTFPSNPHEFTQLLGVQPTKITTTKDGTVRMIWEPNSNTRIRYESHPEGLKPGDPGFNPRHHGQHYHIEIKPDGMSWSQAERKGLIRKIVPVGYVKGQGTGFLPGEPLPGQKQ